MNICFVISPILLGSLRTIKARSKCQGPPCKTLFLLISKANLNMNILLPRLSIFTSAVVFHTCCSAALRPSQLTPLGCKTLPSKHLSAIFLPFSFMALPIATLLSFPSSSVIALHFQISSSVSIGHYTIRNYNNS